MKILEHVLLSDGRAANLIIEGEKIHSIEFLRKDYSRKGRLLALPGLIDPHVHFRVPGGEHKEDWKTGSLAALHGGVTTVFDMPNTDPALIDFEGIDQKVKLIGKPLIDFRLFFGATDSNWWQYPYLADDSRVAGVKVYMGSSTGDLLVSGEKSLRDIFRACARHSIVAAVHAEDEQMIRWHRKKIGRELTLTDHCEIRSTEVELSAVRTALKLQEETRCKVYFCHISTPEALELIKSAKERRAEVFAEVCPHHLYFSKQLLLGEEAAFYKMNPPLRTKEQVMKLRKYLCMSGYVDTVASDHAPHTVEEKQSEKFDNIPSGVPGVQTLFHLIYDFVHRREMSLDHFINLTSRNASRIFNLHAKGRIAPGADADIVLIDPHEEVLMQNEDMKSKCGFTPYDGMVTRGAPKIVVARGEIYDLGEPSSL